jgi:hypothetical protein
MLAAGFKLVDRPVDGSGTESSSSTTFLEHPMNPLSQYQLQYTISRYTQSLCACALLNFTVPQTAGPLMHCSSETNLQN